MTDSPNWSGKTRIPRDQQLFDTIFRSPRWYIQPDPEICASEALPRIVIFELSAMVVMAVAAVMVVGHQH